MSIVKQDCYENRELSWLKFNERVLEEAMDPNVPLCERLSFLSIFQTNLDEFFMVRVGSLHDQMLLDEEVRENKTNMTSREQIDAILSRVHELSAVRDSAYYELMQLLKKQDIRLINFQELDEHEGAYLERYFVSEILPLLSIIIVGKKQPFPFLKNGEIYAVATLETKKNDKKKIGIIPCSHEVFNRLIEIPSRPGTFMLAEELILHFMPNVFKKYRITEKSLMRITRNADIDADRIYDEDLNYRDHMAEVVKRRNKLCPVRMELSRSLGHRMVRDLCQNLELDESQTFRMNSPLDLDFFSKIQDALRSRSNLFFEKRIPQKSPAIDESRPIMETVLEKDVLLFYPYESIRPFLKMLSQAANDPDVISIKMTLYRLARHSKVIEALVQAAENGKQVDVLVELKARFDEENNIEWSRQLEEAGCHVIYGVDGLKVHSKLCLITRKNGDEIEYITQIGTGNYNEKTARLYTDLSLMTSNQDIGREAAGVFRRLSLEETVDDAHHLMVAPKCLQNKVIHLIDREISIAKQGQPAYIGLKLNSLTDKTIIDKLIEASQAGVHIDMVIRGICCLRANVRGFTENINIISIVGRYLEHSRIYIFGTEERETIYIGSADFMTRNTLRRVEVAVPIYDPAIKERLLWIFQTMLHDTEKARHQTVNGIYRKLEISDASAPRLNAQEHFYQMAYEEWKSDEA